MSKISTRKWKDHLDYSLNYNMDFENNMNTETEDCFDRLSEYGLKSFYLSGINKRTKTNTAKLREGRGPCSGVLIGGPFIHLFCDRKRNFTD